MDENKEVKDEGKKAPKKVAPKKEVIVQPKKKVSKAEKTMSAVSASNIGAMHPRYKFFVARHKDWKGELKTMSEWKIIFGDTGLL